MNQKVEHPQLVIKEYHAKGTTFAHCLICSTAPKNAESQYREDLPSEYSLEHLNSLKATLKKFIEEKWQDSGQDVLGKISVILDIHGYNVPLANFEKNSYELLNKKFDKDTEGKNFDDFVLFINFSWPSERVIISQLGRLFQAMPIMLWILVIGAVALSLLFWQNWLYSLGVVLAGLALCLIFLRLAVYFRDRDRAANYGVFDAIELLLWIHKILSDFLQEKTSQSPDLEERFKSEPEFFGVANLSFIAHSMGCFVATQTIRTLSDVFDESSTRRLNNNSSEGPFGGVMVNRSTDIKEKEAAKLRKIGKFFKLRSLILVSPDISIWAITTGRSNFLRTCLSRFEEAYLFTNDADMVLRLASTVANYFVFPSNSRIGGYRLGNLTFTRKRSYGVNSLGNGDLGVRAFFRNVNLAEKPFNSKGGMYQYFTFVDCTDYKDRLFEDESSFRGRRLSALTSNNPLTNLLNYILTTIGHLLSIRKLDSHGGYFRGQFCMDLLYALALHSKPKAQYLLSEKSKSCFCKQLKNHQIAWVEISEDIK